MTGRKYFDHFYQALKLNPRRDIISLVGAGGKTSAMLRLAKELSHENRRVLLTSTTHLEQKTMGSNLIRYSGELTKETLRKIHKSIPEDPVLVAKRLIRGGKIKGLSTLQAEQLNREVAFDYMIVEADSAAKKPLKAPHRYEPAVPRCTTLFIAVAGYGIVGKKLNFSNTHRPRILSRIIGKPLESVIEPRDILTLLEHPQGLLKGRPPATRTAVLLNNVSAGSSEEAKELAREILHRAPGVSSVICGRVNAPRQMLLFS